MFSMNKQQKLQVDACNLESFHSHEHLRSCWGSLKCTESFVKWIHFPHSYDKDTFKENCVCVGVGVGVGVMCAV